MRRFGLLVAGLVLLTGVTAIPMICPRSLNAEGDHLPRCLRHDQPALWDNSKKISLPVLPALYGGEAVSLNERNHIVGWSGNEEAVPNEMELTVYKGRIVLWTLKHV